MITNTSLKRQYFDSFDAFRFFAFLLVFLSHLPKTDLSYVDLFMRSGGVGVSFFFVLSGFLITYILMVEKINKGSISLKSFLIRRILRIWPLYYAMLLFAFSTPYLLELLHLDSSDEGYNPNWWMSIFFLENYMMMITNSFPNGAPLRVMWSICVEEHFYILWGLLLYFIELKKVPILIAFSIIVANCVRVIYASYDIDFLDLLSNLDYFAFGAIPAYIFVFRKDVFSRLVQGIKLRKYLVVFLTGGLVIVFSNIRTEFLNLLMPSVFALLFSGLICCTLIEGGIRIKSENIFSRLGIYTYGLYLFHTIVILLLIQINVKYELDIPRVPFIAMAFLLTLGISYISYHFFERSFLKLKRYFYS